MLADVVLGEHLLLTALLRPRLALGIGLLPLGGGLLALLGLRPLLRLLLPCLIQAHLRGGILRGEFVLLPQLQLVLHFEIPLFLEAHPAGLGIHVGPVEEELVEHFRVSVSAGVPDFHLEIIQTSLKIREFQRNFPPRSLSLFLFFFFFFFFYG